MKKLENLLKNAQEIWIDVGDNKEKQTKFLEWAKENDCKWNDKEIDPKNDVCGFHMGINRNNRIGYVGLDCWFNSKNAPQKIDFDEIIGEKQ